MSGVVTFTLSGDLAMSRNQQHIYRRQIVVSYSTGAILFILACGLGWTPAKDGILFLLGSATMLFLSIHCSRLATDEASHDPQTTT